MLFFSIRFYKYWKFHQYWVIEWLKSHTWQTCNTFWTDVPAGFCVKYTSRWLYKKEKHTHLSIISSFPRIRIFHYSKPVLPLWFRSLLSQFRMKHCPLPEQSNGFYMIMFEQKNFSWERSLKLNNQCLDNDTRFIEMRQIEEKNENSFTHTFMHDVKVFTWIIYVAVLITPSQEYWISEFMSKA